MYPQLGIYSLLLTSFVLYTGLVYTVGTEDLRSNSTDSAKVFAGQRVFRKYNCTACHQLYGLGGHLGPDLTNVASTRGEQYIATILRTGLGAMPRLPLNDSEISELIDFFKAIDVSGESPPRNFKITPWGSIQLIGKTQGTVNAN